MFSQVKSFIKGLFRRENYTLRNFALYLLVLMCIQYIPLETRAGVSPVKVATMGLTIPILLTHIRMNNAIVSGTLYMFWIFVTAALLHPLNFRASTVIYLGMFVCAFVAFHTFVHCFHILKIDFFIRFTEVFIYVLVIVLIMQQACLIVGIRTMPILNLTQILDRGIGANSLSFEPSTLARTLLILFYAYLKCNEYVTGSKISIKQLYDVEHRWVTAAFLWGMLTMGSGTAFICLAILSFYFLRGSQLFAAIPVFIAVYFVLSTLEIRQFERAKNVVVATSSGDANEVVETDGSASARIQPILNTLSIDFSETKSWIGEGCDTSVNARRTDKRYMGEINDYGLIAYFLGLIMIFSSAINFQSLGTVMFFCGVGGGTANIPYQWGLLMILCCVKYFHEQSKNGTLEFEEEEEDCDEDDYEETNDYKLIEDKTY